MSKTTKIPSHRVLLAATPKIEWESGPSDIYGQGTFNGKTLVVMRGNPEAKWKAYYDNHELDTDFWEVRHVEAELVRLAARSRVQIKRELYLQKVHGAKIAAREKQESEERLQANDTWGMF